MEKLKDLLDKEIESQFENVACLTVGSDDKKAAINILSALYRLKLDETKQELEFEEICENRKMEEQFKKGQLKEQVKERYFKLGIAAAEIILPLLFYATWMNRGFKFEESGTYTSTTFRGLFNRFKPTRK